MSKPAPYTVVGVPNQSGNALCSCARKPTPLLCCICGNLVRRGRVKVDCPMHPQVIYYSDLERCPFCFVKAQGTMIPISE